MANLIKTNGLGKQIESQIRQSAAEVGNALNSFGTTLLNSFNNLPFIPSTEDSETFAFPPKIRDQGTSITQVIEFSSFERTTAGVDQKKIFIPCPPNISFNDAASFNTINLGIVGGVAVKALKSTDGSLNPNDLAKSIASQARAAKAEFSKVELLGAALQAVPDAGIGDGIAAFSSKTIINPNTNTTFTGNPIRSFTFGFKLVAESQSESDLVKRIHNRFRAYTYANSRTDQQGTILSFPPLWTVRFLNPDGQENRFIPKIFSCYLVGVESSFNSTANMFHGDGAPLEVDIALTFQETRALTRNDIVSLEGGGFGEDRGLSDSSTTTSIGDSNESQTDDN